MKSQMHVKVIGAGVIGLSTASVLAESGYRVSVIAERPPLETTSAVAAAFWEPFHVGNGDPAWAENTYFHLLSLWEADIDAGISIATVNRFFATESEQQMWEKENPWHASDALPLEYHALPQTSLPRHFTCGVGYDVPVVHMPTYLRYLESRLLTQIKSGISFRRIDNLGDELADTDALVNCTGLGSRTINDVKDLTLHAYRGQILVADFISEVQELTFITTGEDFQDYPLYVVPRGGRDIVLGGTYFLDESDDETPNDAVSQRIKQRCTAIVPALENISIRAVKVGKRPFREGSVRLELDENFQKPVIHNYGHGGGGVTLSWGCAIGVAQRLDNLAAGKR